MKTLSWLAAGTVLGLLVAMAPACGDPAKKCDASNCATGCCDTKGVCQSGLVSTGCGSKGAVCQACGSNQSCQAGLCAATGGGVAPPAPNLSCLQILKCIIDCPDIDTACPDACVEKGSVEGKANVISFAQCIETNGCTDATCLQTNCAASLNLCVTSSAPDTGGTPLQGTAPPGSVPADLVGVWSGARDGITQEMTFNADGTGVWMSAITWQQYACLSFKRTTRTGNFVVGEQGAAAYGPITVYATSVETSERQCVPPDVVTSLGARTENLLWSRPDDPADKNTIFLVDMECAAPHLAKPGWETCNTYGCPIGMYCTSRLTRQ
ncbi:MAG: hypothetical protein ACYC8T_14865 [Myxococcaceae bacterium]